MHHSPEGYSKAIQYRVNPAHRNWQRETAAWIWPSFFHCALETRWLGVQKTCGIAFHRNYRPLLQETGRLVSDFISVCLETRWLGHAVSMCRIDPVVPRALTQQYAPKHAAGKKNMTNVQFLS